MILQNGQRGIHHRGEIDCLEYNKWSKIPRPRSMNVMYWQDGTAQVSVIHTDEKLIRHIYMRTGFTVKIDKLVSKIKKEL